MIHLLLSTVSAISLSDVSHWKDNWSGGYTLASKKNCGTALPAALCAARCLDEKMNVQSIVGVLDDFQGGIGSVDPELTFFAAANAGKTVDGCVCGGDSKHPEMKVTSNQLLYVFQTAGKNQPANSISLATGSNPETLTIAFDTPTDVNGQSCSFIYNKDAQSGSATSAVPSATDAYSTATTAPSYPTGTPMYSGAESVAMSVAAIAAALLVL
jgi:hypothetical protein